MKTWLKVAMVVFVIFGLGAGIFEWLNIARNKDTDIFEDED